MALSTRKSTDGRELTVQVSDLFDFTLHREFRQAYEDAGHVYPTYVIDLRSTTYMDSSALGMLLLLREYAGGEDADIRIVHCQPDIRKILNIANFHHLFRIA